MSEDLETGRIVGGYARAGYNAQRLRELAKKQRKKVSELLAEAIDLYETMNDLEKVDPKCLAIGLRLSEHLLTFSIRLLLEASRIYSSDMVQHIIATYGEAVQQVQQQAQQQAQKEIPDIRNMLMSTMMPLITNLITLVTSMMPGIKPISTIPSPKPKELGVKIIE